MKDDKTKIKEEKLIEMVSSFCDAHLNEEYKSLCIKLVEKLGRKHNVPFKRGKLENWASGIIYAIAQINFLFDKSQEPHTSPDEICDFFSTKKSTASNKARDIRDMFNMGHFDKEFSAAGILDEAPKFFVDEKTGMIVPEEYLHRDPMDEFFDNVYTTFEMGNADEAMEMLDSIPQDSPEYSRATFYKSMLMSMQGNEDEGFKLFHEALINEIMNGSEDLEDYLPDDEGDLDDPDELFAMGMLNYQNEDFFNAIKYFDLANNLKPHPEAFYYKSLSLAAMDEFEEALETINKAIEFDADDDSYWNDKGNFLAKLGNSDEAQRCFDKAIELNPTDCILWSNKAFLYLEEDEDEKALECYDKAIEVDPGNIHPILGKANTYMAMADLNNAQKYFEMAKDIDENDINYLTNYGHLMLLKRRYKAAIKLWDKCLKIDENQPMVWIYKAMAYAGLNNMRMADKCIEKAGQLDPFALFMMDDLFDDD